MNESLWRRIEAALDERVDPFEVPALAADLAADPEAARETSRLTAGLALLSASGARAPERFLPRRVAAVAALMLVLVGAALYLRQQAASARVEPGAPERILTVELRVEHSTPPPPRGARVILEPRQVRGWTLEGNAP
jgi:hypothetical protein